MSVIDVVIEPNRVTRVFFDGRAATPGSTDQRRIEQQVARSLALAQADTTGVRTASAVDCSNPRLH